MDNNQMQSANHIIEHLKAIDVDGETMEYIIDEVGMSYQILRQLMMTANDLDISNIIEERNSFHDRGNNNHLNVHAKQYEVGIDEGNEGTRTIAFFSTWKEAQLFLYDYGLRHQGTKLFIDTCTDDFIAQEEKSMAESRSHDCDDCYGCEKCEG